MSQFPKKVSRGNMLGCWAYCVTHGTFFPYYWSQVVKLDLSENPQEQPCFLLLTPCQVSRLLPGEIRCLQGWEAAEVEEPWVAIKHFHNLTRKHANFSHILLYCTLRITCCTVYLTRKVKANLFSVWKKVRKYFIFFWKFRKLATRSQLFSKAAN